MKKSDVLALFQKVPLAIMTGLNPDKLQQIKEFLQVCIDAGVPAVEVLDCMLEVELQQRLDAFAELQESVGDNLALGVGTLIEEEQVNGFLGLDMDFGVSPISNEVLDPIDEANVLCIRGGATATEIRDIQDKGDGIAKAFHAENPRNVSTVLTLGLNPKKPIVLIATGGVKFSNLVTDWAPVMHKRRGCTIGVGFGNEWETEIYQGQSTTLKGQLKSAVRTMTVPD